MIFYYSIGVEADEEFAVSLFMMISLNYVFLTPSTMKQ